MSKKCRKFWAPSYALLFTLLSLGCGKVLDIPDYGLKPGADGVFCDSKSQRNSCGLSASGKPKTCFAASQLGGRDTCTDACDPSQPSPDPTRFVCLASGALLQICDPDAPASCPEGLNCFRTDILHEVDVDALKLYPKQDPGLCIAMPVCTHDADCAALPTRHLCAGEIIGQLAPTLDSLLATKNTECFQGCDDPAAPCPTGEQCLSDLQDPSLPKLCVPTCKSGSCPPNFFCLVNAGSGYPPLCVPGLPGYRCAHPEDCLFGYCADTGAGFSMCTARCDNDVGCELLGTLREPNLCLKAPGVGSTDTTAAGICVTKAPFAGPACVHTDQCPDGQRCSAYEPYNPNVPRTGALECRRLCDSTRHCPAVGNMRYVCLPIGECYPGDMGLPCTSTAECMGDLTCETVEPPSALDGGSPVRICTQACKSVEVCRGYSNSAKQCRGGFCQLLPP